MFRRKLHRQPRTIEATLSDKNGVQYTKTILVPDGCKVNHRPFSSDLVIRNANGSIRQEVNFQAGHTILLNYFY